MSTPMQYYNGLPPVSKTFAVICVLTSAAYHLHLYHLETIALLYDDVIKRFQLWRLITNFFFLEVFAIRVAFRILLILRHGVQLERKVYDRRTGDFLWMLIFGAFSLLAMSMIPYLWSPFMGGSLVFMIVYIWGREFPDAPINFYGLFELKGFYLPWYMIAIDCIIGNSLKEDLLGVAAGHLYHFLTVLYPRYSGRDILKTPLWVYKLVDYWGEGYQMNTPVRSRYGSSVTAFQGQGRRLNGARSSGSPQDQAGVAAPMGQTNQADGVVFRGQGRRVGGH